MLIQKKTIFETQGSPLMILEKHSINPENFNFKKAQLELLNYEKQKAENQCTWGFFPQIEKNPELYPECKKLQNELQDGLIRKEKLDWRLAFIRVASKEPNSEFGGFHIDVDIGIMHKKDEKHEDKEIARMLINPHHCPRKLQYIENQDEPKKDGISKTEYKILNPPDSLKKTIEIPPMEKKAIYILKFISSIIPHTGITDNNGHFLIAYGAYINKGESIS